MTEDEKLVLLELLKRKQWLDAGNVFQRMFPDSG